MTLTAGVIDVKTPEELVLWHTRVDADDPIWRILTEDFGRTPSMRPMIYVNEILDRILWNGEDFPLKKIQPTWYHLKSVI